MKTFKVTIKIQGLTGERTMVKEIKAKTEKAAQAKAYDIIGNQSGWIESIQLKG